MKYLLVLILSSLFINPCSKEEQKTQTAVNETNTVKDDKQQEMNENNKVFLGRYMNGKLIIEDNYSYTRTEYTWAKDTMENYDKYCSYLKTCAKKYAGYTEDKTEYVFDGFKDEFKKLTSLRIGDKINASSSGGVFQTAITKYYMNFDDMVGTGIVFYSVAEPVRLPLADYEIVVCSDNSKISKLNKEKILLNENPGLFKSVNSLLMEKAKNIKIKDESSGNEIYTPVTSIDTSELIILSGSFTSSGTEEYIAGYTKRQSFDNFAYYIVIVNSKGELVKEFTEPVKDSFTFETVIGVVDVNNDGVFEILTEDGYYEGSGYNLHKLEGKKYKTVTSGFFFGV